jgi:hypothetical protein
MKFLVRATVECEIEADSLEAAYDKIHEMTVFDMLDINGSYVYGEHVADPDTGNEIPDPKA